MFAYEKPSHISVQFMCIKESTLYSLGLVSVQLLSSNVGYATSNLDNSTSYIIGLLLNA